MSVCGVQVTARAAEAASTAGSTGWKGKAMSTVSRHHLSLWDGATSQRLVMMRLNQCLSPILGPDCVEEAVE